MLDCLVRIGRTISSIGSIGFSSLALISLYVLFCMGTAGEDFYEEEIKQWKTLLKIFLICCVVFTLLMIIFYHL